MTEPGFEWLTAGTGFAPQRRWSFATDAPLVAFDGSRESAELFAADESGRLYLLDRRGRILALQARVPAQGVAWSDGRGGYVRHSDATLCRLDRRLEVQWQVELHDAIVAVACTPTGGFVAVSLANSTVCVFDCEKRRVAEFPTFRPLAFLRFLVDRPGLVGAAEYGLLARYDFDGEEVWNEKLWSNAGDLCVTGDGKRILMAAFNHGIQVFGRDGTTRGTYAVEGTATRVAATFVSNRIVAATLERHLYWLNDDGELLWAAMTPDDVRGLFCDPLGNWIYCGLQSGRLMRLDWEQPLERLEDSTADPEADSPRDPPPPDADW